MSLVLGDQPRADDPDVPDLQRRLVALRRELGVLRLENHQLRSENERLRDALRDHASWLRGGASRDCSVELTAGTSVGPRRPPARSTRRGILGA